MFTVVFSWILLFIIFLSFGEVAVTFWNTIAKRQDSYSITDKFWIGICFIGTLLLWLSIFSPLNIWILVVTLAVTLVIIATRRRVFQEHFSKIFDFAKKAPLTMKIMLAFASIAVLIYSLSTSICYDQGLYHLQSMLWTEKYPVVYGLGNLHGRLAFNSSFLLLMTVFNYHPNEYYTAFTLNSLCLLVFAIWMIKKIYETHSIVRIATLATILILSIFSLGITASSSSTDVLTNIFVIYVLLKWVLSEDNKFAENHPFMIASLTIFCVTMKLSSTMILLALAVMLALMFLQKDKRSIYLILLLGIIVALPWLTRYVLLSGYLVYPFPSIDIFSFDWKIPKEMVIHEKDLTYAWARMQSSDTVQVLAMSLTEWLPIWASTVSLYIKTLYVTALCSPLLIILFWRTIKNKVLILIWAVAYSGVLFNVLTAPDMRFAFGYLLMAIAIPILLVTTENKKHVYARNALYILTLISLIYLWDSAYGGVEFYRKRSIRSEIGLLHRPVPINMILKHDQIIFNEYKIGNTTLSVPQATDRCIDQALPCTPYYNSNLEMRGNEIQDGFRIKH